MSYIYHLLNYNNIPTSIVNHTSEIGLPFTQFLKCKPRSKEELLKLIDLAVNNNLILYPISKGQNLGYGFDFPIDKDHIVVDLSLLNKILNYDRETGEVIIQPGVTQKQLYEFLKDKPHLMDSTGAGEDSSVLGNALDGGFGYSPYGAKRYSVYNLEVVLPNSETIYTGHPFDAGPNITGLFIQSNFGIVISATLKLFPKPEKIKTIIIEPINDNIDLVISKLYKYRANNYLPNIIHFGNQMRIYMSTNSNSDYIRAEDLDKLYSFKWIGYGALMGTDKVINIHAKEIRKALKGVAKVIVLDDTLLQFLLKLLSNKFIVSLFKDKLTKLLVKISGVLELYSIQSGEPITKPLENIQQGYGDNLGLLWLNILVPNKQLVIRNIVQKLELIFQEHQQKLPITISMIEPHTVIMVININFDKTNELEVKAAHQLYYNALDCIHQEGLKPYRHGNLEYSKIIDKDKANFITLLKHGIPNYQILNNQKYIKY